MGEMSAASGMVVGSVPVTRLGQKMLVSADRPHETDQDADPQPHHAARRLASGVGGHQKTTRDRRKEPIRHAREREMFVL